jgi:hypothetical protein
MATTRSALGTFNGSIGDVTFSKWKHQNVVKQKVPARNTSKSPAQEAQRRRFALLAGIGGLLGPALRIGFRTAATKSTEQNVFQSLNSETVTDNGTVATIDMPMVRISSGTVGAVSGLTARYDGGTGELTIDYSDNSNGADALPSDIAVMAAYDSATKQAGVTFAADTRTNAKAAVVQMAAGLKAADISVFCFFKRASSTSASPSAYVQAK